MSVQVAAPNDVHSRKLSLLQEFDTTIAPQKLQLEQALPQLWQLCYAPPTKLQTIQPAANAVGAPVEQLAPKPAAGKRTPAGPVDGPLAKRPKNQEDLEKRMDDIWKQCKGIVEKIWKKETHAKWFRKPVDPVGDGVPNYLQVVKEPMDLGTIKACLGKKLYTNPLKFRDDMRKVWSNCALYNLPGHPVRKAGDTLSAIWENLWKDSNVEAAWQEIQLERDPDMPLEQKIGFLNQLLQRAVSAAPPMPLPPRTEEFPFLEKRKLSVRLGTIQADQVQHIMNIITEDPAGLGGSDEDGEVELDLDSLASSTLWRIKEYLDTKPGSAKGPIKHEAHVSQPSRKPSPVQPAPAAAPQASGSDSDSEQGSPQDVKGSTMDDPHAHAGSMFVRDARHAVDESATNAKEQPLFMKDKAARKAEMAINAANWNLTEGAGTDDAAAQAEGQGEAASDDMWKSFQTIAEQKMQREEEQKRREEQQRQEQERRVREEEERRRKLKEAEEKAALDKQRDREEQLAKELAEIEAKAGTANLDQQGDMALLQQMPHTNAEGLAQLGLHYRDDNEDLTFEDDD
eukprot:CAMPEP_0202904786 /NCGR_PEP_ID=MMETSP1392-20130828/31084_1 /ASSEMBLY_ACC=CAM_ASM_000868 /TAXON_ID=225041 /ORGANISM="Chlamydomonas chlamydogama, Strain SAG 11-48b" /LENGTH=568 /DNA_ID=CAMNT_0049592595 /DNA_START=65 /DNA_END=1771 /DNA_ORIENTATION=-